MFYLDQPKAISLHRVWDTAILRGIIGETKVAEFADTLDAEITEDDRWKWNKRTATQWANEGHKIARESVYKDIPADGDPPKIGPDYVTANRPVVKGQLQRAGIRPAALLNRAFEKSTTRPVSTPAP